MAECDACGDDVPRLFEHRARTDTMTHQRTRYVCAECHPSMPSTADRLVTDGGVPTTCPTCSGTTVATDDSYACVDCGWTPHR